MQSKPSNPVQSRYLIARLPLKADEKEKEMKEKTAVLARSLLRSLSYPSILLYMTFILTETPHRPSEKQRQVERKRNR